MRNFYFIISLFLFSICFAQSVNLYNPPPQGNGNPYPDQQYFCMGEQFNLKVDAVATTTGDYAITRDSPTNFPLTSGGTPIIFPATGSNKFSNSFPIGFTFSFYGKDYTKVAMGSNGRLVFTNNDSALDNLNNISTYTDRTFSGVAGYNTHSILPSTDYNKIFKNNPTQELNLSQIFFGYTDLVPKSLNGSVNYLYKNVTVGSNNALLITFQNQIRTNGNGGNSGFPPYSSNVLLIDDGRIVIYVSNKTEDTYNAILGIQNDDATKFKVPTHSTSGSDYNNGKWKSEGTAMVFTPNQTLIPKYKWLRNGVEILGQTSDTFDTTLFTSPVLSDGDVLKVEVTYHDPLGAQVGAMVSDQVKFEKLKVPSVAIVYSDCAKIELETALIPGVRYEWYKVGVGFLLSTTNKCTVTVSGAYYVRIIRDEPGRPLCYIDSYALALNVNGQFPPFDSSPKYICKTDGSTTTTVDLYDYFPADPSKYSLDFQENGVDVPNYSAFSIDENTTRTINIIAKNTAGTCTFTNTLTLVFASLPVVGAPYSPDKICNSVTTYTAADFKTKFFPTINYDILFSTDGVNYTLNSVNPSVNNPVFVQIKHPNFACETTGTINFSMHPQVEVKPYTPFPEHCNSTTEFFDLNITKTELEYLPEIKVTFYRDQALTNEITNLQYRGSGKVYIKIENINTGCYANSVPELDLKIYPPPTLIKTTPETKYSPCGSTIFDLTTNINDYIGVWGHYSEIRYFDAAGTQLSQAEWEDYDFSVRNQPYMIFVYNETNNLQCSNRIEFNLIALLKPVAIKNEIQICAETTYPLQEFKNQVATNPAQYTFTDLSENPLPTNFDLSGSTLPTVNFLMKDNTTGCVSDPQSVSFVKGTNSVLIKDETDYTLCDEDFDGKTEFNLQSKESDFTGSPATFEYFKDALFDQKIENFTKYVNENPFDETVYVKITISGFCPSLGKIHLKVNMPTNIQFSGNTDLCFQENLSFSILNLNNFNSVKLISPDGTEAAITTDYTINYVDVQFGKIYIIKAENTLGCISEINFTPSDENQPRIDVINQTNNSIEVIASGGAKPYSYYFNSVPQTSNVLQNPTQSSYEIQVESATGCLGPPKTIYFIKINNAFTPNGDGVNDTWKIENLDKMQEVSIVIINRNGTKVFESTNPSKSEWDGKSNGRELPTSSYWYVVTWFDAVTQKNEQRQGWILLKNRN